MPPARSDLRPSARPGGPDAPDARQHSTGAADERRHASRLSVSAGELAVLGAALAVGLVALVSLASAHLHHHTPVVVGVGSVVLLVLVGLAVVRAPRPAIRSDLAGLLPILVGLAFAAVMMIPGFQYGTGDRDPGAYIEHAVAISGHHSVEFPNDLAQAGLPGITSPGAAWPGLWDKPGDPGIIFPQFYHLWPSLLATAKDAGGFTGMFNTGALIGVLCCGLAVAVGRRLAGWPAAWAVAVLLPTNMLEVWQAKYPSAEIFGQLLFLGALLGVVLTLQTRWRSVAAVAGVFVGLGYLERPDGILVVMLAWAGLAALLAFRRFDARAAWFAGGLVVLLPYGFYQAYGPASVYTLANGIPSFAKVAAVMLGLAVIGAALGAQGGLTAHIAALVATAPRRRLVGLVFVLMCGLLALIGGLRPRLFGPDYGLAGGRPTRTFDEISLIRLSWFFSLPGLTLMMAGIVFVGLRRWSLDRWVVALPAVALLTLYCFHARNSAYLMWSTRRFVTTVVPGMILLMGCGAALVVVVIRHLLPRLHVPLAIAVVGALLVGLTTFNLSESLPLRHHDENGGSIEIEHEIAAVAGNQRGVFLWSRSGYCCNAPYQLFGGPLLATAGQSSALLPGSPAKVPGVLRLYLNHFAGSGRPVFFIGDKGGVPPAMPGVSAAQVLHLTGALPHWEETFTSRPKRTHDYPYDFAVYRLSKDE
jgi:hypothetical protein